MDWLDPSTSPTPMDGDGTPSEFRVNNDIFESGDVHYSSEVTGTTSFYMYGLNEYETYVDNSEEHPYFKFYVDNVDSVDERLSTKYTMDLIKRGQYDEIYSTNKITLPSVNVILLDANPPKIHHMFYHGGEQRGIQNSQEVIYNNEGVDIISDDYLNMSSDGFLVNQDDRLISRNREIMSRAFLGVLVS